MARLQREPPTTRGAALTASGVGRKRGVQQGPVMEPLYCARDSRQSSWDRQRTARSHSHRLHTAHGHPARAPLEASAVLPSSAQAHGMSLILLTTLAQLVGEWKFASIQCSRNSQYPASTFCACGPSHTEHTEFAECTADNGRIEVPSMLPAKSGQSTT